MTTCAKKEGKQRSKSSSCISESSALTQSEIVPSSSRRVEELVILRPLIEKLKAVEKEMQQLPKNIEEQDSNYAAELDRVWMNINIEIGQKVCELLGAI